MKHLQKDQIIMGFVASCVESASEKVNCNPLQMWERMSKVDFIDGYLIPYYDTLHTESRESLTLSILDTLKRWEARTNA